MYLEGDHRILICSHVPIRRELFMCLEVPILMGSLEVWEQHPWAHALGWPSITRTHLYKNLPLYNKKFVMQVHTTMNTYMVQQRHHHTPKKHVHYRPFSKGFFGASDFALSYHHIHHEACSMSHNHYNHPLMKALGILSNGGVHEITYLLLPSSRCS